MQTVFIYSDKGVGPLSLKMTAKAFIEEGMRVSLVKKRDLQEGALSSSPSLFVMPGGADLFYHKALKGAPNKMIKAYVEGGGSYLGICAGAYYGCREISFEKGHKEEVIGERELSFFDGTAEGPVFGLGSFQTNRDEDGRVVEIRMKDGMLYPSFFLGGCTFLGAPSKDIVSVYEKHPEKSAHICLPFGRGRVNLLGFHPEFCYTHLKPSEKMKTLYEALKECEPMRKALFRRILNEFVL